MQHADARRTQADLRQAIEDTLGWDRLAASLDIAAGALGADEGDGLDALIGRHASLRKVAAVLFEAFVFRSFKPHDPILTAIDLLRALYCRQRRKLPDRVPTVFLKRPCEVDPGIWTGGLALALILGTRRGARR